MISKVQPEKKERERSKISVFSTEIEYFVLLHSPHNANSKKSFFERKENLIESLKFSSEKSESILQMFKV